MLIPQGHKLRRDRDWGPDTILCFYCGDLILEAMVFWYGATSTKLHLHPACAVSLAHHLASDAQPCP